MVIKGDVDMLSKVLYTKGRCEIGQVCITMLKLLALVVGMYLGSYSLMIHVHLFCIAEVSAHNTDKLSTLLLYCAG